VTGVILSYAVVIIYTTIGGLRSVMFTNLIQFFLMIIAIPMITIFGLSKIGIYNFIAHLPHDKVFCTKNNHLLINIISATLGFIVMGLYPSFIQRALINNNPSETSRAIYRKSIIYGVFLVFITINGLIAYNLYPSVDSNIALPYLINQIMPVGLQGLVVVGLLAAVMSTADSDLNIISVTLVKDLFDPIFKVQNQQRLLFIARVINVIIGSSAIIIALSFNSVVDLVIFISGSWGPVILVPLVFALFEVTITRKMMVICSLSGGLTFLLWEYYCTDYFIIKGVFVGTAVSLMVFLLSFPRRR
jgi:Na+/proline symporter